MALGEPRLTEGSAPQGVVAAARRPKQSRTAAGARTGRSRAHEDQPRDAMDDRDDDEMLDEHFSNFLDSVDESALPDLPKFPGFHVCWVSTMNPHDRPERRQRMGYEFIFVADVPGWKDVEGPKAGEYAGVIRVNEMVAMKVDERLYQRFMKHFHHDEPIQDEEKLRQRVESIKEGAEALGSVIEEGDGTASIVQRGQGRPGHIFT